MGITNRTITGINDSDNEHIHERHHTQHTDDDEHADLFLEARKEHENHMSDVFGQMGVTNRTISGLSDHEHEHRLSRIEHLSESEQSMDFGHGDEFIDDEKDLDPLTQQ